MSHYYNEFDADACDTLRLEMSRGRLPQGTIDHKSITDVQPSDLVGFSQCDFFAGIGGAGYARRLAGWPDELELWTGGFPCQDISVAGKGAGLEGSRSGLWWEWFRLIEACRPVRLLIENVPALRTRGADAVLAALEGIGYACRAIVVGAEHVGAPHRRHRVWIVADGEQREGVERCDPAMQRRRAREAEQAGMGGGELGDARGEPGERHAGRLPSSQDGIRGARQSDGDQLERPELAGASELERTGLVHPAEPRLEGHGADAGQPQGCEPGGAGASVGDAEFCGIRLSGRAEDAGAAREVQGGQKERQRIRPDVATADGVGTRWPSRPGQPQHEWERPRLFTLPRLAPSMWRFFGANHPAMVECAAAVEAEKKRLAGVAATLSVDLMESVGRSVDGIPARLGKRNKARLKQFGNAWVPQVAAAIMRAWIRA